jgi:hypothetical protein
MNVAMREHVTFDNELLDVAKFTTVTAISLLIFALYTASCQLGCGSRVFSVYTVDGTYVLML